MQISFQIPVLNLSNKDSLHFAYTQRSFWQLYTTSAYFRETNYAPELFFRHLVSKNFTWKLSVLHQSNGRGSELQRGWNRLYGEAIFSGTHWMVSFKPWVVFKDADKARNNDITHFLGNGKILLAYKLGSNVFSLMTRNNVQSNFKRGAEELT